MKMNLVTDPWIPVVFHDGTNSLVSLIDAFSDGHKIRDLSVRPHERIAIMRLIVCIAQAGLEGPRDWAAWEQCKDRIPSAAISYLKEWQHHFELFGDGPRFLQIEGLAVKNKHEEVNEDNSTSSSKLDLSLATGNNTTLFDNAASGETREFSSHQLACMLLTYQCFSPGGRIGVLQWHDGETPGKGASNHAPCTGSIIHTLIRGKDFLETIHCNLIHRERAEAVYGNDGWGKPLWECMPKDFNDLAAVQNATKTYLGRLVPLSRAVRLIDRRFVILANAFKYATYPEFREATVTTLLFTDKKKKEQIQTLLRTSTDKAIWRELHSILVHHRQCTNQMSGALALANLNDQHDFDLWTGALITDQAKVLDTIESVFHIPASMLNDFGRIIYENGVNYASQWAAALETSIKSYAKTLKIEEPSVFIKKAHSSFWASAENMVPLLFQLTIDPSPLGLLNDFSSSDWGKAMWKNAQNAYRTTCPSYTPRQIEAFSIGQKSLYVKQPNCQRKEYK